MLSTLRSLAKTGPYRFVFITVSSSVIVGLLYLRHLNFTWMDWTGFEGETLWSVLELLIIPLTIAGVAAYLEGQERIADRENIKDNQRETALQNYFDAMTSLILDKGLKKSKEGDEVREITQVKTLTTIEKLDSIRKGKLVEFLSEIGLVRGNENKTPIINLNHAHLEHAMLVIVHLEGSHLKAAQMDSANLIGAHLEGAHMEGAHLNDAHLETAHLEGTHLYGGNLLGDHKLDETSILRSVMLRVIQETVQPLGAQLERANLEGAYGEKSDLRYACLKGASLAGATLVGANLEGAYLVGANLEGANLRDSNLMFAILEGVNLEFTILEGAKLEGAIMPDGEKFDPAIHIIEKITEANPEDWIET